MRLRLLFILTTMFGMCLSAQVKSLGDEPGRHNI